MIHVQESSPIQSTAFTRLHQAGKTLSAILRNSVKARPGLWLGIAALAVFGAAWAIVKLLFAGGGAAILALLRDAGHQVGGGGLPGAAGAGAGGGGGPVASRNFPGEDDPDPNLKLGPDGKRYHFAGAPVEPVDWYPPGYEDPPDSLEGHFYPEPKSPWGFKGVKDPS